MKPNLDMIRTEIEQYLEEAGIAVFYGYARPMESVLAVYWDCDQYPDYKQFVKAAQSTGVKLIVFHQREFSSDELEDALEQLEGCEMPRDDYKEMERRLSAARLYEGMICTVQLSFDHEGRVFLFELRTEWYDEFTDLVDELQILGADVDEDDTPIGGYFSKN